ncbi:MAG: autotransporter-associated beta strand repeat-containing protein [Pirellulales bacterium]|nr:autotransporter-associated beta strand repeat-containing protein [Pirellulales bacterium]
MNKRFFFLALITTSLAFLPSFSQAALIWDSVPGSGAVDEGDGDWNATNDNWWDEGTSSNVQWDSGAAQFGYDVGDGTGYTVTVDAGGVSATGLTFLRQYTLQGGPITLTGTAPEIVVPDGTVSATAPTFNSNISTTGDLVLRGAYATPSTSYSKFILGGSNTYHSLTVTDGGLCDVNNAAALDSTTGVTIDEGASVRIQADGTYGQNISVGGYGFGTANTLHSSRAALMLDGNVELAGNIELTADASIAPLTNPRTVSGVISGDYSLTKTSTGTLVLTNQNTFTGALQIYRANVELNCTTGPAISGDVNFISTSGTGSVYLVLPQDNQFSSSSVLHFTGYRGYVQLVDSDQTVAGLDCTHATSAKSAFIDGYDGPSTLTIDNDTDYTYVGGLRDQTGTLAIVKRGTGTQYLSGGSSSSYVTFSGGLTVEEGTLNVNIANRTNLESSIVVNSPGVLDVSAWTGFNIPDGRSLGGDGTVLGSVIMAGGSDLQPGSSAGLLSISGDLDLSDAGTAANMTWEMALLSDNEFDAGTAYDQVYVGGNLALGGLSSLTLDFTLLGGNGPASSNAFWSSAHSWKIIDTTTNTGDTDFYSLLNGIQPRGLFETAVSAGDILLNFTPLNRSDLLWVGGAGGNLWDVETTANWYKDGAPPLTTFKNYDDVTFDNSSSNQSVTINSTVQPVGILVDCDASHNYSFLGTGSFSASTLTKDGLGTLTVANDGPNTIIDGLTLTQGTLLFQQDDGNTEIRGDLTGAGSLQQNGTGSATLLLGGDNSGFAGPIIVTGGILLAGSDTALGDTAHDTVVSGGTLDVGGRDLSAEHVFVQGNGANGNGAIISSNATDQIFALNHVTVTGTNLTLGGNAGRWDVRGEDAETFGDLDDNLSNPEDRITLTKKGTGTVGISWCNVTEKLGDINIEEGMLTFDGGSTMGDMSKTVTISSGGTFGFWAPGYEITRPIVSNGGRISNEGGGATPVVLSGPITINGDTTISTASGTVTEIPIAITGTGGIIQEGTGTLWLEGANQYSGDTYIGTSTTPGGILSLSCETNYAVPGNIVFQNSGRIRLYQGEEDGGQAQIPAAGTVTFTDTAGSQYLDLRGHTLTLEGIDIPNYDIIGDDHVALQNTVGDTTGRLILDSQNNHNFRGIIRDNGGQLALEKKGPGTLALWGARTGEFTGGLTVSAGTLDVNNGYLPATGLVQVTGGTLDMGYSSQTVAAFQITDGALNGYGSLTNNTTDFDVQGGIINAYLYGAVGLVKTGTGTATLTNYNYYYGPTEIREGTLVLSGAASIDSSPAIRLSGGIFDVSGLYSTYNLGSFSSQALTGSGTVRGSLALGYAGALKPGTPATAGTLAIVSYGGSNGNLDLSNAGGATMEFQLSGDATGPENDLLTVADALSGPSYGAVAVDFHAFDAALDTSNPYTLVTFGPSTYLDANTQFAVTNDTRYNSTLSLTGGTTGTPTSGTLQISFSGTGPIALTWNDSLGYGAYWDNSKTTTNWKDGGNNDESFYEMDAVTFNNNSTYCTVDISDPVYPGSVTVDNDVAHPYTFFSGTGAGSICGRTGIDKSGNGTLYLNNGNNFAGEVAITEGTVILGAPNALGNTEGATVVSGTGVLDLGNQELPLGEVVRISGNGTGAGALVNSADPTVIVNNVKNLELDADAALGGAADWKIGGNPGGMVGGGHTLTKVGAGTVKIDNMGGTGLGDIVVQEGRLELVGDTEIGSSTVTLDNVNAGTGGVAELSFNGSTVAHQKDLIVTGNGGTIVAKNGTAVFAGSPGSNSGQLGGNLNAKMSGGDTLSLAHNFTGTGSISVNQEKTTDGTLELTGSSDHEGGSHLYAGTLSLNCATGPAITDGDITLYGSSNGKFLQLARDGQLTDATTVRFDYGAGGGSMYFYLQGNDVTVGGLDASYCWTDSQAVIANAASDDSNGVLTIDNDTDCKYRSVIRDSGGTLELRKQGSGALTLAGSKSGQYTGGLTVEDGTLNYAGGMFPSYNGGPDDTIVNGVLPNCDYTITGGTLNIGNLSAAIGTFKITGGTVQADTSGGGGVLTSNATYDVQGGVVQAVLSGDVGLDKTGPGTATLTAVNAYTGATSITGGTLTLASTGQIETSSAIVNDATFVIDGGAHTLSAVSGAGTTHVTDAATITAPSITQGTLIIGGSAAAAAGATPVPEPGVWALLLIGLSGCLAWRKIRSRG